MKKILSLVLIFISCSVFAQIAEQKVIAVLPFKTAGGEMTKGVGIVLHGSLISTLQNEKKYKIVDRAVFEQVMNEQSIASSDLSSSQNAIKLGKLLSASYLLTGSLVEEKNRFIVTASIISTTTGKVERAIQPIYFNDVAKTPAIARRIIVRLLYPNSEFDLGEDFIGNWVVIETAPYIKQLSLDYKKIILNDDNTYELHMINNADSLIIFKGYYTVSKNQIDFRPQQLFMDGNQNAFSQGVKLEGTIYLVDGKLYFNMAGEKNSGKRPDAMDKKYRNIAVRKD